MSALWILLLTLTVSTLANETLTIPNNNITTLYPVFNNNIIRNEIRTRLSDTEIKHSDTRMNDTETKMNDTETRMNNTEIRVNEIRRKNAENKINKTEIKTKPATQSWNIETTLVESNITEDDNNVTDARQEKKELLKDFKPSQHLGSFFDDDNAEVIKRPVHGPVKKKPASGFISSIKDEYPYHAPYNKIPKEIYYTHQQFPYKFDDTIYTKTKGRWTDSMESKPTVEVPVKVPAGGLYYKSPETFKETSYSNEEFGLEYHEDGKEHSVKKRVNPWQNLLRLVTAFIPVGLIISALTPSLITIHNVDNLQPSSLPYRRSDSGMSNVAPISEQCRRRLLCELHSEGNYVPPSTLPRRTMKHCYKIHCEDTDALWRMLRWLFTYNQGDGNQRGRLLT